MADTKISALTSGDPAQSGDQIPIARSGANYKITAGSIAALGGGLTWQSVQTGNFTASAGNAYPVNTTSAAITVTLPASPSAGDLITLMDYAGTFATNNMTVSPNGNKINGSLVPATFATNQSSVQLAYIDATQGWKAYSFSVTSLTQTILIDYLVVAGGASGGAQFGGGGGAGGRKIGTLSVTPGSSYSTTVGGGGASINGDTNGNAGSNSVLSTITATGGGYGAKADTATSGGSGGSGGGGGRGGAGGSGTSGEGNNGGGSGSSGSYGGGGGGGSGATGSSGTTSAGGNGGAGSEWPSGSGVFYAGGGGGGVYISGTVGSGGNGGGGAGGISYGSSTNGVSGTANTGGGGGGGGTNSGAGGSGVVIIRYADSFSALASTTGSPTITVSGGYRTYKWTGNGSFTV